MDEEYIKLKKKAMVYMYLKSLMTTILLTGIVAAAMWLIPLKHELIEWTGYGLICIKILMMLTGPYYRYHAYRFKIDDEAIDIKDGFITMKRHIVPIERLHTLEISNGPILRFLGLANLNVMTAGSEVEISMIDEALAERISGSLRAKINEIVRDSRGEDSV